MKVKGHMKANVIITALRLAVAGALSLAFQVNGETGEKWTPVAFGASPIFELPGQDHDVKGFRFNLLAGRHCNVYGVDLGIVANICDNSCAGLAFAGICNVVGDSAWSAQFSAICNYSDNYSRGFQFSMVNWSDEDFAGGQIGLFNCVGDFAGLQMGVLNSAESGGGFQFGMVNVSGEFSGVQFGLININLSSGVPVLPIMNVMF